MAKVFREDIVPACDYCIFGRPAPDADAVLCVKHGIMDTASSCRSFKYDPLKRAPRPKPQINRDFDPYDFEI